MAEEGEERTAAIAAAAEIGIDLPEEAIAGVIANRALLTRALNRVAAVLGEDPE